MNTIVSLTWNDTPLIVTGYYSPRQEMTWDCPGEAADFDIEQIKLSSGQDVTALIFGYSSEDDLRAAILDQIAEENLLAQDRMGGGEDYDYDFRDAA